MVYEVTVLFWYSIDSTPVLQCASDQIGKLLVRHGEAKGHNRPETRPRIWDGPSSSGEAIHRPHEPVPAGAGL
jgi:hypothetical protein